MHLTRIIFQSRPFRSIYHQNNLIKKNAPFIKILSNDDEDVLKLSFKYSNSPYLNIKAPKSENVKTILTRIKLMVELQLKREEIRQSVINKYSLTSNQVTVKNVEEDVDICLMLNDREIEENIPNIDAWSQASSLKIGGIVYEVKYNMPSVISLSLPDCILSECAMRPHFILECASRSDSIFTWYRSISKEEAMAMIDNGETDKVLVGDERCWLKVHEGFVYYTQVLDIGCFLRVTCLPKSGDNVGMEEHAMSKSVVEAWPKKFPFQERQSFTKSVCDENSIRCVSYNTLANVYVEKRKFPYCSVRARDMYYRKQILLKEIAGYNSDIMCLQEVQERNFYYDFLPVMSDFGFSGFYSRKGGRRNEGLALFYRTSKYRLIENHGILLNVILKEKGIFTDLLTKIAGNYKDLSKLLAQDTAFQIALLEQIGKPERKLIVSNTHLYSNKDMPEVRLMQAAICTQFIEHFVKTKDMNSIALLFCGDFNSLPHSTTYDFMLSGKSECSAEWTNGTSLNVDPILRHDLSLESACGTPKYTNYTEEFHGCLDYIFYSKNFLEVSEVVPMPSHEHVTANVGLPNEYFPSDHIALVCTLKWKC